jgi:hypothetical protein
MGYVDEILFGREVIDEMPQIVKEWISLADQRGKSGMPEDISEKRSVLVANTNTRSNLRD